MQITYVFGPNRTELPMHAEMCNRAIESIERSLSKAVIGNLPELQISMETRTGINGMPELEVEFVLFGSAYSMIMFMNTRMKNVNLMFSVYGRPVGGIMAPLFSEKIDAFVNKKLNGIYQSFSQYV